MKSNLHNIITQKNIGLTVDSDRIDISINESLFSFNNFLNHNIVILRRFFFNSFILFYSFFFFFCYLLTTIRCKLCTIIFYAKGNKLIIKSRPHCLIYNYYNIKNQIHPFNFLCFKFAFKSTSTFFKTPGI